MKVWLPLFAVGALASIAQPVRRQNPDVAVVSDALNAIISANRALATQINAFQGLPDVGSLAQAVSDLLNIVKSGTQKISGISVLGLTEALPLGTLATDLISSTKTAVDAAISKHDAISAACAGNTAYTLLGQLQPAAADFASTLNGKAPDELKGVVTMTANSVNSDLQRGIDAYADQATPPASCSGGGSSSSSSSSTSAPTGPTSSPPTSSTGTTSPPGGVYTTAPTSTSTGGSIAPYTTTTKSPITKYTGAAAPSAVADFGMIVLAAAVALL